MATETTPDPLAEAKWLREFAADEGKTWVLSGDNSTSDRLDRIAARHEAMAEALSQGVRLIRALEETGK